jgi:hypothetical protein
MSPACERLVVLGGSLANSGERLKPSGYEPFAPSSARWRFESAETDLWGRLCGRSPHQSRPAR